MLKITKSKDFEKPNTFTILYGDPGSGKTYFSLNNDYKKLYISLFDDGGLSVLKDEFDFDIVDLSDSQNIASDIKKTCLELNSKDYDYDVIIFDPFTMIEDKCTRFIGKGQSLTIQQWGDLQRMTLAIIRELQQLRKKYNVVVIMHANVIEMSNHENKTVHKYVPALREHPRVFLGSITNDIIYFAKVKKDYKVYFQDAPFAYTKTRTEYSEENFSLKTIINGGSNE